MRNIERILSWSLVAGLGTFVTVQQITIINRPAGDAVIAREVKALRQDIANRIRAEDLALARARAAQQEAARNDLRALPSNDFRSGPQPWGRD